MKPGDVIQPNKQVPPLPPGVTPVSAAPPTSVSSAPDTLATSPVAATQSAAEAATPTAQPPTPLTTAPATAVATSPIPTTLSSAVSPTVPTPTPPTAGLPSAAPSSEITEEKLPESNRRARRLLKILTFGGAGLGVAAAAVIIILVVRSQQHTAGPATISPQDAFKQAEQQAANGQSANSPANSGASAPTNSSPAAGSNPATAASPSGSSTQLSASDQDAIKAQANKVYQAVQAAYQTSQQPADVANSMQQQGLITAAFANQVKAANSPLPFTCTPYQPDSFSLGTPAGSSGGASLLITLAAGGTQPKVNTGWVKNGGMWQLNTASCSQ